MPEESEKTLDVAETVESDNDVLDTQGEEEISTENEEMEFDESSIEENSNENENAESIDSEDKKIQSSEENAKYAAKRREKEDIKFKLDEAYKKGQLDAYKGKINPYTQTEIKVCMILEFMKICINSIRKEKIL